MWPNSVQILINQTHFPWKVHLESIIRHHSKPTLTASALSKTGNGCFPEGRAWAATKTSQIFCSFVSKSLNYFKMQNVGWASPGPWVGPVNHTGETALPLAEGLPLLWSHGAWAWNAGWVQQLLCIAVTSSICWSSHQVYIQQACTLTCEIKHFKLMPAIPVLGKWR